MSKTIDLGESQKYEVNLEGENYPLVEPNVEHMRKYREALKQASEDDNLDLFLNLVTDLGLPEEQANKLSLTQMKKLSEGIFGDLDKKK